MPAGAGKSRNERLVEEAIDSQNAKQLFELLESEPDKSIIMDAIQTAIITKAWEVAAGTEEDVFHANMYRGVYHTVYGHVLRRIDPIEGQSNSGAALVLGIQRYYGRGFFWLVSLRYATFLGLSRIEATQISQLSLNKPEHLRLIWDVIGGS